MINRGNARAEVFRKSADSAAFRELLQTAAASVRMRMFAYCLRPNHVHLARWLREDSDLSRVTQWLLTVLPAGTAGLDGVGECTAIRRGRPRTRAEK